MPTWDTPIHQLPVELLAKVFTTVAQDAPSPPSPASWLQLLLVCRHWKEVASTWGPLWRVIHVSTNLDWLRLCIKRSSRSSSIDVHINALPAATIEVAIPHIITQAPRVRALHVTGYAEPSQMLSALLACYELPLLEELSILPPGRRSEREYQYMLSTARHPRIRALALSGATVPRDSGFFANMRSLRLHDHCCELSKLSFLDLLDALEAAAPVLEELDLSRFTPYVNPAGPSEETAQALHSHAPLHFLRLRRFCAENSSAAVLPLMYHIRGLPADVTLHIRCGLHPLDAERHRTRALEALVPFHLRYALGPAQTLVATFTRNRFSARAIVSSPAFAHPERTTIELHNLTPDTAPRLAILPTLFAVAAPHLAALHVQTDRPSVQGDWDALLSTFPALTHLRVEGARYAPLVARALLAAEGPVVRPHYRAGAGGDRATAVIVRCPVLAELRLDWENEPPDSRGALRKWLGEGLRSRAGHAPKLRLFGIYRLPGMREGGLRDAFKWLVEEGLVDALEVMGYPAMQAALGAVINGVGGGGGER
ncbi:uncharacterized protein BXZ73DRAFT_98273 [Epithele typhae]|uniref:uncharacterized protein n=1 Tax=Epithele typhae TaxID=378194 RepID=UPI002008A735|nr:uncharacterized protein BXZ73DRAFT_98273 [Epithele typhae]KAH9941885.1 hypothetical protein BXZ73DRAFT_98273 [Epithele typhae]